jgi:hypothetical protein
LEKDQIVSANVHCMPPRISKSGSSLV